MTSYILKAAGQSRTGSMDPRATHAERAASLSSPITSGKFRD